MVGGGGVPVALELPIAPDPLGIARRLTEAGLPHVALLWVSAPGPDPFARWSFVAAAPDRVSHALDPFEHDDARPEPSGSPPVGSVLASAPRWIGIVPYEFLRDRERPAWAPRDQRPAASLARPEWHRYPAVACVDHLEGRVLAVGARRTDAEELAGLLRPASSVFAGAVVTRPASAGRSAARFHLEAIDDEPLARHAERIAAARELIARGDLYQVNLARRIRVALRGGDPLDLMQRLGVAAPTPFAACLALGDDVTVVSTTPELLLRADPLPAGRFDRAFGPVRESSVVSGGFGTLLTCPIKGTRPRGIDALDDAARVRDLDADPKERAELAMIVDVERNDLGRVAEIGSVRVLGPPRIVTHRTVHHREAWVAARARPGVSRAEVLAAMLPSGSVTGAPKVRAMEVIASLEPFRRGLYTGALGYVAHDGGVTLAMAIRTLVLFPREGMGSRQGEYLAGGGIVIDSDPEREVEETRWKALQLARAAAGP